MARGCQLPNHLLRFPLRPFTSPLAGLATHRERERAQPTLPNLTFRLEQPSSDPARRRDEPEFRLGHQQRPAVAKDTYLVSPEPKSLVVHL